MAHPKAFTLVELLVVISIIVLLISLLAPALDTAVYKAQITVDAAQIGSMGRGILTYTVDFKRFYPRQPRIDRGDDQAQPHDLASGVLVDGPKDDDMRPVLKRMFNLKIMADPLSPRVDLDTHTGGANVQLVMGCYCNWFGWRYIGEQGMFKLGDRFSWTGLPNPANALPVGAEPRTAKFNLLVSDRQHLKINTETQAGHPDKTGTLRPLQLQDSTNNPWVPAFQVTFSTWYRASNEPAPDQPGPMDLSYGHDDGSVGTLYDVLPYDTRTFPVPERNGNKNPGQYFLFIPQ